MHLKTKKKIAKEVLLLLSCAVIALIIFIMVYPYNWYCDYKSESIQTLITSKTIQSDSLNNNFNTKLKQALRDFVATSNSLKYKTEEELMSKFPEFKGYDIQSLRDFVATANSNKYSEEELFSKFPEFGFGNVKKNEILKLTSEKQMWEKKAMTTTEQMEFAIKTLIIALIFLYPIRFLYWLIVWSFKTLKQKGE